ncbi:pleckstrin homology domain-containing family A member 5 isoform X10 [Callorhinchus milii]|uniref:pleckstrin homology domain-containing family A member 5 isoform X10 n=1 Tax=Callorhinchus milii TaxID=7868 RepID=UPI001C3F5479|nr:pleckstrin homology domain-containing family A member 5 isoform X10 [Callorhinchus milii]
MAELRHELLRLPAAWSHGVTRGGRVFFLNEEAQSTTWLHPATGQAVISGHRTAPDLPTGWEEGYSFEGARYYIKPFQSPNVKRSLMYFYEKNEEGLMTWQCLQESTGLQVWRC